VMARCVLHSCQRLFCEPATNQTHMSLRDISSQLPDEFRRCLIKRLSTKAFDVLKRLSTRAVSSIFLTTYMLYVLTTYTTTEYHSTLDLRVIKKKKTTTEKVAGVRSGKRLAVTVGAERESSLLTTYSSEST